MDEKRSRPDGRQDRDQSSANGALILFDSGPWAHRLATENLDQYHHGKVSDLDGFFDQLHVVSFPHAHKLSARFSPRHWFHQVTAAGPQSPIPGIDFFAGNAIDHGSPGQGSQQSRGRRFQQWSSPIRMPRFFLPGSSAGTALSMLQAVAFGRTIAASRPLAAAAANDPFLRGLAAVALAHSVTPRLPAVLVVRGDYEQVRRLRGQPILSIFGNDLDMDRAFERWVFSQMDLVIADRDYYADYALAHGALPDRVAKVGMAVHEDFYDELPGKWDPSWGNEGDDPNKPLLSALSRSADRYVLVVGRLADEKYPLDALDAISLARRTTKLDVVGIFSGNGPLAPALIRRAKELGMTDALFLPGNLDRKRLRRAMAECDALLAPCTGFALAEAALRAAPIVAYDWEWHSEVVAAERTGLLAPFRDAHAMGRALSRLLENPSLARRLGSQARRHAIDHFAPGKNIQNLRRAYRDVMDRVRRLTFP